MIINHNLNAMNAHRQMGINNTQMSKSIEKLSTGLRINRAGDDAAGLAISEKMRGQIRGLEQASRNAQDGISLIQIAEGAMNETHSILQRMRELAVQASNDTNTAEDREELQKEVDQLIEEIDRISDTTEFNTKKLLNGDREGVTSEAGFVEFDERTNETIFSAVTFETSATTVNDSTYNVKITGSSDTVSWAGSTYTTYTVSWEDSLGNSGTVSVASAGGAITISDGAGNDGVVLTLGALSTNSIGEEATLTSRKTVANTTDNSLTYQIGANSSQVMNVDISNMDSSSLHVDKIDVTSAQGAEAAITAVNRAIEDVSTERAKLGAFQNRLEHSIKNLDTAAENIQAAESRIRDTDMAKEMMNQTRNSILSQAAQSMLAQANQQPQQVLQLLR